MAVGTAVLIGSLVGIILTVLVYVLVMPKKRYPSLKGFFKFLHDFFMFKKLYIEVVLKFFYVLSNGIVIGVGFFLLFGQLKLGNYVLGSTFLLGLGCIILGPIILRIMYELMMLTIMLVVNTSEINNKLGGSEDGISFADEDKIAEKIKRKKQ